MRKIAPNPKQKVIDYFSKLESRWGYTLLLKGTKHFGYYPKGKENLTMAQAQKLMEDKLSEKLSLPQNSLVLDAGCGEGNVAIHLAKESGLLIKGVDLLDFSVQKAKEKAEKLGLKNRATFYLMDYSKLDFESNMFDGLYTMETLVHAVNYKRALKEFYRVLKPKGKLVLFEYSIAQKKDIILEHQKITDMIIWESGMHSLPHFTHGRFPKILKEVGFKSVYVEDISLRIMPMLKRFYQIAYVPYFFIKLLGLQRKFINTTFAVEMYKFILSNKDNYLAKYNIVTATKS